MSKKKSDPFAAREAAKYDRPIPSREFILSHLLQRKAPANYPTLIEELKLHSDEEQLALHRRLKAMFREKQIERLKDGYFWPAGHRILVKGRVHVEKGKKNVIWVIPDDGSTRILIAQEDAPPLYQGNHVVASVINIESKAHLREGHVVEIIEQQRLVITGRFVKENDILYVIPHGREFTQDVLIPAGNEKTAKDGDIVIVEIAMQPTRWSEPIGKIIEILGHENSAGIEVIAASRAYGIPEKWPETVLSEIKHLTEEVPESAKKNRFDIRHLPLVTIDGEDAKDYDDAVYCEHKPGSGFQLYVAIADVSHYVHPNTALDKEAAARGNSVYFPGKVIPMLPEILSNGLCSLKPEVERLCMVCVLNINAEGKVTRYQFHEGLMRSAARLTYTKVAALLEGKSTHLAQQYAALMPHLLALKDLYLVLKKARESRGAIEFESLETRIIFGKNGKISRIEPVVRNDAHRIIEECMLCANVATAGFIKKHKLPGLYRIHEGPPEDKLTDLKLFLKELGLSLGGGKKPHSLDYAKLLRSIQNRKDANIIQSVLLRSLSQAVYSPDNLGHFGLAYEEYCHFTSPIRRYPDLLVHRHIRSVLQGNWTPAKKQEAQKEESQKALIALGDHSSMTERRADDATRDVVRWLKCEYIQKHIGDIFEGIISGVTRFGFFVELKDIYIDGLVHVTSLKNDYYYFDAVHHRLIGERSGIVYKLGDLVKVKVGRVDIDERKIDFELIAAQGKKKNVSNKSEKSSGTPYDKKKTGKKNNKRRSSAFAKPSKEDKKSLNTTSKTRADKPKAQRKRKRKSKSKKQVD